MFNRKTIRIIEEEKDRSSLFYNKYEWAVYWLQKEINLLRDSLDEYKVEKAVANARYWEKQRWNNRWDMYGNRKTDNFKSAITKSVVDDLHITRLMLAEQPDAKRVMGLGYITVYTNDSKFKDQLVDHGQQHSFVTIRHANVVYPPDTIALKEPKYKYRTYLRSRQVTDESIEILKNWIEAQAGEIAPSPGIKYFMEHRKTGYYYPTNYTADYHYFDHNDMRYLTMLRMVLPVAIRKTVSIIAK